MLKKLKNTTCISLLVIILCAVPTISHAKRDYPKSMEALIKHGSVYVTGKDGAPIMTLNVKEKLVPASIIKIVTASAAYHYLGAEYRFLTEFYIDAKANLYIKGYGDPLLISEELDLISDVFKRKGVKRIGAIYLDNSFYDPGIKIDGVERSLNPYDATNGALCVNFNTLNVTVKKGGEIISREPQTPMTEFAKKIVRKKMKTKKVSKKVNERIVLSHKKDETLLYTGHLLKAFLEKKGISVKGVIKKKFVPVGTKLFYAHHSSRTLDEVIVTLMKYSTNFTANQIFLTMGAKVYGAPATVKKSVKAVKEFLRKKHGITSVSIAEGSGISRLNRISAKDLMTLLIDYTKEHDDTLNENGGATYKTGTLSNVKSAAGFIVRNKVLNNFVIMLNDETDYKKRSKIIELIKELVNGEN